MKFSRVRQGYVNGPPWIGQLDALSKRCSINFGEGSSIYHVEHVLLTDRDLYFQVFDEDELNDTLLRSLGRRSIDDDENKAIIVVIWASSVDSPRSPRPVDHRSSILVEGNIILDEEVPQAFEASFQVSELATDADLLTFGDCSEKTSHVREFTITNLSNCRLYYQITTSNLDGETASDERELALSFYDNGTAIKSGTVLDLPGRSFARIHATLKPSQCGQRLWIIAVENEKNTKNLVEISVRANVLANDSHTPQVQTPNFQMLEVLDLGNRPLSAGIINLSGEIYAGICVRKRLILRNTGQVGMDVTLVSQDIQGYGAISLVDGTNLPMDLLDAPSDSDKEDDGNSPRIPVASVPPVAGTPIPESMSISASVDLPSDGGVFGQATFLGDEDSHGMESGEPRTRSDTIGSSSGVHRSSFNSLASPSAAPPKKIEQPNVRERRGSQESLSSMPRLPPVTKVREPEYELPPNESIHLNGGDEREVVLNYLPANPSANAGPDKIRTMVKQSIKVSFVYGQPLKPRHFKNMLVECKVCSSFAVATPTVIKFGDCIINHARISTVTFTNQSELETEIKLNVHSNNLRVEPTSFSLEPRGSAQVTITFTPRTTNSNYTKQIECINMKNKENKIVISVSASVVDLNNSAYHDYFCKIFAFDGGQEVDFANWPTFFGPTLLEGISVRRIGMRNLTAHDLALSFKYSEEIQLLAPAADFKEEFDRLIASFEQATYSRSKKKREINYIGDDRRKENDEIVESAERRLQALAQAQAQAKLRKVTTARFAPDGFQTFALVFRPTTAKRPHVRGALVYEGSMSLDIEMTEFFNEEMEALQQAYRWTFSSKSGTDGGKGEDDQPNYLQAAKGLKKKDSGTFQNVSASVPADHNEPGLGERASAGTETSGGSATTTTVRLPIREVPLRATVAKSCMKLSQSHFSFGAVTSSWERRQATATLFNLSSIPLLFRLEKRSLPGNLMPSCVDLSDETLTGVVPPFGNENINLLFVPRTWRGKVTEIVGIRNVLDGSSIDIVVKAEVCIPEHFRVEGEELDFGPCLPGVTTNSARFLTLSNTTKKSREIVIQVSSSHTRTWPKGHVPVFCFHLFPPQTGEATQDVVSAQEQSEILEHQIRVATRKLDHEKVAMLTRKLAGLSTGQGRGRSDVAGLTSRVPRLAPIGPLKGSVLVPIPPQSTVKVAMWLHVRLMTSQAAFQGYATHLPGLRIYESKQGDQVVKHVPFSCELFANKQLYMKATGASPLLVPSGLGSPNIPSLKIGRSPSLSGMSLRDKSGSISVAPAEAGVTSTEPGDGSLPHTSRRQIEVGTQTINQWFTIVLELACASTVHTMTPRIGLNVAASTTPQVLNDCDFRFITDVANEAGSSKNPLEVKVPTGEIVVTAKEAKRQVKLEARYVRGGRHHNPLVIVRRNRATGEETWEEFMVKGQASFLEIDPPFLDFGNVVVVPPEEKTVEREQPFTLANPIKTIRVTVKNTNSDIVFVIAESNSNQVVVFSAETSEQIDRVLLEPNQTLEMDVSVKPSLLADAWKGMCRSLRGGVVVTCVTGSEDNRDQQHEARYPSTIPFAGVVGMSVFSVAEQRFPGTIRVLNKSDKLPLRIEASSDSEDVKFTPATRSIEVAPASELDIGVRSVSGFSGLCFRNISILNLDTNESQHLLKVACALNSNDIIRIEKGFGVRVAVPVRKRNNKDFVVAQDAVSDEPVRIRNVSERRIKITMRCGYTVAEGPIEELDPPFLSGRDLTPVASGGNRTSPASPAGKGKSSELVARAECTIQPGNHRDVYFKFPRDSRLVQGSFRGWLSLDLKTGGEECAAAVKFQGEARVSQFVLDRVKVDAGEFGAGNQWEPRTVELARVINTDSFVPADVEVNIITQRDFIRVIPIRPRFHVEPGFLGHLILGTVQVIEHAYKSAFPGSSSGVDFETTVKLSNALNIENEASFSVRTRVCPRRFFIEKDGEEIESTLLLPTVEYELGPSTLSPPNVPLPSPPPLASHSAQSTTTTITAPPQGSLLSAAALTTNSASSVKSVASTLSTVSTAISTVSISNVVAPVPSSTSASGSATAQKEPSEQISSSVHSVNEWISIVNTSLVAELALETSCTTTHSADVNLLMVFRSTGAPVPPILKLKPGERTNIRVVLRVEKGCGLRGEVEEFGRARFIAVGTQEETVLRIGGRVNGPPLLRVLPEKKWELRPGEKYQGTVWNDTRSPLVLLMTAADSNVVGFDRVEQGPITSSERKVDSTTKLVVPPFGCAPIQLVAKKLGLTKIKLESDPPRPMGNAHAEVLVDYFPILPTLSTNDVGQEDNSSLLLTPKSSPTTPKARKAATVTSSHDSPSGLSLSHSFPSITGATFVSEPGLYEIDAGILSEPRTWTLSGITGEVSLVSAGLKGADAAWVTMRRAAPDVIQLKLSPQYFGDTGGFFAAYLIAPGQALVRIKMEVVMRDTDKIAQPLPLTVGSDSLPFDLLPAQIHTGPLYLDRHRAFPFTLFNRHPQIPLVFQLTVSGLKGGLQAWFSFWGGEEEHRRVTIMPSSCCRLAINILGPGEQTEDFGSLEVNIACRHLRNSRLPLVVTLPKRALHPHFALSSTDCKVGKSIRVEPIAYATPSTSGLDQTPMNMNVGAGGLGILPMSPTASASAPNEFLVVGPEWINVSRKLGPALGASDNSKKEFGLTRCRGVIGDDIHITEAQAPGNLTVYCAADPDDFLSLRVSKGSIPGPPAGGASRWRDAIEMELARFCVTRTLSCPPDIVFREIYELLLRDPGGRGSSIAALYFRLRFGDDKLNDTNQATREKQMSELKSLPEGLMLNFSELL